MTRSIRDLVSKYQSLEPSDRKKKRAVKKALELVIQFDIPESHIHIQHTTAFLTLHPIEKKSILVHKEKILHAIHEILGTQSILILK